MAYKHFINSFASFYLSGMIPIYRKVDKKNESDIIIDGDYSQ